MKDKAKEEIKSLGEEYEVQIVPRGEMKYMRGEKCEGAK